MFKRLLAAPVLGLLFVVFLPVVGFAVVLSAVAEAGLGALTRLAGALERWAGLQASPGGR